MSAEYRRLKIRRKTLLAASLAVLPLFAACGDGQKEATNTAQEKVHLLSLFELEGDVTDSTTQLGEDWNTVFTGGNAIRTAGPTTDGPNHSIFTQGSKDIDDLSVWHWGEGSAPDKDELITAYAAAYVLNGDLIAYFGANRYAVDGDAQIGFWFFKNKITLVDNAKGTDDFSGVHAVGDVLILSDFTQGGTIGNIGVYKWDVVEQKGQNVIFGPKFVAGGVPAPDQNDTHVFCLEGGATDDLACATINSAPLNPTNWPTETKGVNGNDADIPPGGFFEGGLNLTDLVGGNTCFSSFMAETRSSQSITATLKDFVLSSFETCAVSIVKDCSNTVTNPPGSPKQFASTWTATVTNSGAGGLPVGTVITVQDDNGTPSDKTDDPPAQSCKLDTIVPAGEAVEPSDGEPGAPCSFGGTIQTDVNGVTNSVAVTAQINGTTLSASDSDDCPGAPLEPELLVCKFCNTALQVVGGQVVVGVTFGGEVCNDGNLPLQITLADDPAAEDPLVLTNLDANGYLDPGECGTYSGSYFPTSSSTDPQAATYADTLTVTGDHPALTEPLEKEAPASCGLCATNDACDANPPEGGAGGAGGTSGSGGTGGTGPG